MKPAADEKPDEKPSATPPVVPEMTTEERLKAWVRKELALHASGASHEEREKMNP